MRADQLVIAVATPAGTAFLYFLLAGELSVAEAIACVPVEIIACLYAVAAARTGTAPLQLAARGVWSLVKACGAVLPDMLRVCRGLLLAVLGRRDAAGFGVKHVPFRFGALRADDIGRRAAIGLAVSLSPNGFALGMDYETDELIVHQFVHHPIGGDREWPV